MENKYCTKICRFCLEKSDNNFETIEQVTFANLDCLWLKLNLSISEEPVMCGDCAITIRNCSIFKTKCLDVEKCIGSAVKNKDNFQIDLRKVYVRKLPVKNIVNVPEEYMVCRLCLELEKNSSAICLRKITDILVKLEQYFPELDLACTVDPVICASCQVSLQQYFSFTNTCLTSEEKITEYCKVEGTNGMDQIDLNSVIHFISKDFVKCKLEVDTLKIEETGNDDSENAYNDVEVKKEEILHMELDIKEKSPQQESVLTDDNSFQHHPSPSQSDSVPQLTRAKPAKRTCKICGYQSNCYGLLQAHVLAHKGIVQEFNCEMCPFKTTTKYYLKKHMLRHKDASEVTLYKCAMCTYETKYKRSLRRHTLVHKDESEIEMHKCKLCSYQTKWRDNLRKHVLSHGNTPPAVKYDLCDYKTKGNADLKKHVLTLETHSEVTVYKCKLCEYETKWKDYLKKHMLIHKTYPEISMFSCCHCGYETIYKENLKKHMVLHMDVSNIKVYKCDLCDFETKWKVSLKGHLLTHQTHSKITMYQCYNCEYESKRKGDLRRHMLTHQDPSKITMFKCGHCDHEAKNKDNLQKHMRKHKG